MRILRIAQKVYPDVTGGGPYHVHAMSRDQAAMGHDVTILTVTDDDDLPRRERRDGYTVVRRARTVQVLGNDISGGLARFLRRSEKFDVLHAHSHLYFSTNVAALWRRIDGVPLAITNHGLYSQNAPEWLFRAYLRSAGRWTFNQGDLVFCYTDEDRDRVRSLGVRSDVAVVPNGVDTERFSPEGSPSSRIDHDGPVVLFVGRLVEGKRPQDAVASIKMIEGYDAKLYIVGDGPLRGSIAERARGEPVELLGHVPYDEMPSLYQAADVLVLPSRAEGLPRTVLEAFASGVPVVSSHLEHTAPVVRTAGETVEIGDTEGYAEALQRVLADRNRLGERGRQTALEEFRWKNTVEQTTEELANLL